jgi:protoporphyrinogen oxidase
MTDQQSAQTLTSRVAVVGGGVLGMFLALRLRQQGAEVTLLESTSRGGGLAEHDVIGGYHWDRFYHVILLSDLHTRALLDELGLGDTLRWGVTRTGFYTDGKLYSLSDSVEFLKFPPLSLIDKFRLGGTIFLASRIKDWKKLENQNCVDWLRRWSGNRVVEKIWLPLLKSKLGENYKVASAAFIWTIIARMYAARRSGLKREMFGYVDGGYQLVLAALEKKLRDSGVNIRYGAAVSSIEDAGRDVTVKLRDGGSETFDRVVATVPTGAFASLCPQLGAAERRKLDDVTYQGIVCASMLTKKPLGPYYVTNITDRWVPFTGVIEMTALVDRERFGGNSLVYLPRYLTQGEAFWQKTDEEVREEFVSALEKMYPGFNRADVLAFNVSRARQVLAVSTLGYSDRLLPSIATSLKNVFLLNSAQIAAGTLNVNETLGVVHANIAALTKALRT